MALLQFTSTYPTPDDDANLDAMLTLRSEFGLPVGYSDHTLGSDAIEAAVALGAQIIEKHFTLDRSDGGVDSAFSMEPHEMKSLVDESLKASQSLGRVKYGPGNKELESRRFRRSLYIVEDIGKGEEITEKNMRSIRPGLGLHIRYYSTLLGKKVNTNVKRGTALTWDLISSSI